MKKSSNEKFIKTINSEFGITISNLNGSKSDTKVQNKKDRSIS
jgi:hypothetical protein